MTSLTQAVKLGVVDLAETSVGVSLANSLNLSQKLNFGDNFILKNASSGAIYFLVSDVINGATGKGSKLLNYDFYGSVDDALYFSGLSGIADISNADNIAFNLLSSYGLSRNLAAILAESAIVTGGRFLADSIDANPNAPSVLKMLRHPVSSIAGRI